METSDKAAPLVSKRPKAKGDKSTPKEEQSNWEEFGDVELRADLDELLKKDPIARLGYDPEVIKYGMKGKNASYSSSTDTVEYGPEYGSSKAVITHEFRHRGLKRLKDLIKENTEYFVDNFGQEPVDLLLSTDEEKLVETYDHIKDKYINELDAEGNPLEKDITSTVQRRNPVQLENLQKGFDESKPLLRGESKPRADRWPSVYTDSKDPLAILRMAEQVLRDTGEVGQKPVGTVGAGKYNKGGEVTQMDKMLKEGGLATDGLDIDPVSGNEIPPGSNAKDVRDDVDAKLSEGEYVVPADVVKYFGVSYFEKLRSKAKEGLASMAKDGRMGGDPEEMEHTLGSDLMALDGYAAGGMVEGMDVNGLIDRVKAAATKDPSITNMLKAKGIFVQEPQPQGVMQKQAMSTGSVPTQAAPPAIQGQDTPTAFAEGGLAYNTGEYDPAKYTSDFDPNAYQMGFSTRPGFFSKPSGDASTQCPDGFVWDPVAKVCMPVASKTAEELKAEEDAAAALALKQNEGGPDREGQDPGSWSDKFSYDDPEALFNETMDTLGAGSKSKDSDDDQSFLGGLTDVAKGLFAGSALGLGAGLAGKAYNSSVSAQAAANSMALAQMGKTDLANQVNKANEAFVDKTNISSVPTSFRSGKNLFSSLADKLGSRVSTEGGSSAADMEAAAPEGMDYNRDTGSYTRAGSAAPTSSSRPSGRPGGSDGSSGPSASPSDGGDMAGGNRNRGGLIPSRKKTKAAAPAKPKGKRGLGSK